jgi:hypothetical protein
MITRIQEVDEFEFFNSNFKKAFNANPQMLTNLI